MGLFSKLTNVCNICGANIIGINPQKIADGHICNNCKLKLSPDLKHCESMTAADVFEHIKIREANRANLSYFQPTRILLAPRSDDDSLYGTPIYIDENNGKLMFSNSNDYRHSNADILDFSDIRSFTFTESVLDKSGYINISVRVYSEICRAIVEHTYEWSVELPFRFRKKPGQYPPYSAMLTEVQNTQAYFNAIAADYSEQPSYAPVVPPLPSEDDEETVNVSCPNCGAMTTLIGPSANCQYCGLTIENEYYIDDETVEDIEEDDQVSCVEEVDDVEDTEAYTDDYGDGYLDNSFAETRSDGFGAGYSYANNNYELPEINIGGNGLGDSLGSSSSITPPTVQPQVAQSSIPTPPSLRGGNSGGITPPPINRGIKAGPPSLNSAIKRTNEKQVIGGLVKDNLAKNTVNQAAKGITKTASSQVGKQVGGYAIKQVGGQAGKAVAVQAGKQIGKGVAVQAGRQVGRNVALQAGKQVGKGVAVQAGRQVGRSIAIQAGKQVGGGIAKQAMNSAGKAVAKQAVNTAGKAVAKQAAKSAGKAVAKQASKSVAKSVGKAAAKGALNSFKKMI